MSFCTEKYLVSLSCRAVVAATCEAKLKEPDNKSAHVFDPAKHVDPAWRQTSSTPSKPSDIQNAPENLVSALVMPQRAKDERSPATHLCAILRHHIK
jgi:hypothetical protein